jgi:hypothetical protein
VTYEVGDRAYLRVSPLCGVKRFGVKGKLAPRFVGPFKVLARKGEVAYELELPESLSAVHNVFHVSQLKKFSWEVISCMKRNPSKYWRHWKELLKPRRSSFARFSGITTLRKKQLGNEKMNSEKTTPTYLLANPNLEGEIHLKGG